VSRGFYLSYDPCVKGISFIVRPLCQGYLIHRTPLVSRVSHSSYNPCVKGISFIIQPLCQGYLIEVFISLSSRVVQQSNSQNRLYCLFWNPKICRTTLGSRESHLSLIVHPLGQGHFIHRTTLGSRVFHLLYDPWVKGISFVVQPLGQGHFICRTTLMAWDIHFPFVKGRTMVQPPLKLVIWPFLTPHSLSYNPWVKGFSFIIRPLGSREIYCVGRLSYDPCVKGVCHCRMTLCQGKNVAEGARSLLRLPVRRRTDGSWMPPIPGVVHP